MSICDSGAASGDCTAGGKLRQHVNEVIKQLLYVHQTFMVLTGIYTVPHDEIEIWWVFSINFIPGETMNLRLELVWKRVLIQWVTRALNCWSLHWIAICSGLRTQDLRGSKTKVQTCMEGGSVANAEWILTGGDVNSLKEFA